MQIKGNYNHWAITILIIIFMCLATVFSVALPLGESADEQDHFTLVRFIAEEKRIPLTLQEQRMLGNKGDASPIYHSLVALLSQYVDIASLPKLPRQQIPERFIPFDSFRSYTIFHTEDEFFPFRGIVLAWHSARLVSVLLGAVTVLAIYLTGLTIYPKRRYFALAMACFAMFIPRFVISSASVNDDSLVVALTTLAVYCLIRIVNGSRGKTDFILAGVLIGLAVIAKYHPIVLLFEMTLIFVFLARQEGWSWRFLLKSWGLVIISFLCLVIPWFIFLFYRFNQIDTLGLVAGLLAPLGDSDITKAVNKTDILRQFDWTGWIKPFFQTFWIEYGGVQWFAPRVVYQLLILPMAASVLGLVKVGYEYLNSEQKSLNKFPAGIVLLILHGLIYLSIVFTRYQMIGSMRGAQGRHVYPALVSIAFFFVLGIRGLLSGISRFVGQQQSGYAFRDKIMATAIGVALFSLNVITLFAFILPVYLPDYLPITSLEPGEVAIGNRLEHSFTKAIKFVGYDLKSANNQVWETIPLNLYWKTQKKIAQDYAVRLCLQDNRGEIVSCHLGHPADGMYPTRAWETPYLIRDEVHFPLPACIKSGTYTLTLSLLPLRSDILYAAFNLTTLPETSLFLGEIILQKKRDH